MAQQNDGLPCKPACELVGIHVKVEGETSLHPVVRSLDSTLTVACEPPHNTIRGIFGNSFRFSMELTIHKGTPLGDRWGYILGLSKMIFKNILIRH